MPTLAPACAPAAVSSNSHCSPYGFSLRTQSKGLPGFSTETTALGRRARIRWSRVPLRRRMVDQVRMNETSTAPLF